MDRRAHARGENDRPTGSQPLAPTSGNPRRVDLAVEKLGARDFMEVHMDTEPALEV